MTGRERVNVLVNLPPGFFLCAQLAPCFERLDALGEVRQTSHATLETMEPDLAWEEAWIGWGWPEVTNAPVAKAPRLRFAGHINCQQETAPTPLKRGIAVSEARRCWSCQRLFISMRLLILCTITLSEK